MAAEQVQIRRDSNTNLVAATPADGELGYDQTNKRIIIGDGSKAGGSPIPSYRDVQSQAFIAGTTTGSANAHVLGLTTQLQPIAYATYQKFCFIAGYTNTGTCTLTVTPLGAKTIKKVVNGSLADLSAGDITTGRPYEVVYDGTYMVLLNNIASGVSASSFEDAAAGDYITAIALPDTANNPPGVSYIKVAEIKAPRAGTYRVRIKIERDTGTAGTIYGRVYVNGGAAGTELSESASAPAFQNDDIAVNAGDLVQLYMKGSSSSVEWEFPINASLYPPCGIVLCELNPIVGGTLYTYESEWT